MSDDRRSRAQMLKRIGDASAVGLAFPIAILIGYFWGRALDSYLGTAPWCTYIFAGFGIVAGFLNAVRVAVRVGREEDDAGTPGRRG